MGLARGVVVALAAQVEMINHEPTFEAAPGETNNVTVHYAPSTKNRYQDSYVFRDLNNPVSAVAPCTQSASTIDCGAGTDTLYADAGIDMWPTTGPGACETVKLS